MCTPFSFIIFISLTLSLKAYVITDFSIQDLFETGHDLFLEDVAFWALSSAVSSNRTEVTTAYNETSPAVFNAPSRIILGGYNILGPSGESTLNQYFERQYSGLKLHSFLTFQALMFFMDNYWAGQSQVMEFHIDSSVVPGTKISYGPDSWTHEGGNPGILDVGFVRVRGRVPHSGSSLNFRVVSTTPVSSITAPFGFRELSIYLSNYSTDTSIAICQTTPEKYPLAYNQCNCQLNQAADSTGACQTCTNNCQDCFGVANLECHRCNDNAYWTGLGCNLCDSTCKTCKGPSDHDCLTCPSGFVHNPSGECSSTCHDPYVLVATSDGGYCKSPCDSGGYYWYANQSCLGDCSSPLKNVTISGSLNVCQNPCSSLDNYLYENEYCSVTCNPLFVTKNEVGVKFCRNPCPATERYIYPDSTCRATCDAPFALVTTPEGDFCKSPCSSTSKFYWTANQSCLANCLSPLTSTMIPGGLEVCQNPCPSASNDYLYENGYCSSTSCNALFSEKIEVGVKFCVNPCPVTEKYIYPDSACRATCGDPFVLLTTSEGTFCKSPCHVTTEFYWAANQSCLGSCSFPLESAMTPIGNLQICQNPCSSVDDFLYEDRSCSSFCGDLFTKKIETGAKFCNNPCPSSAKYIYPDSTCKSTCEYPYAISGNSTLAVCVLDLDTDTVEQVKSLTETSAVGNSVSNAGGMFGSLLGASDPASMCLGPFAKMLQFIKFMNITYPAKVELMLQSQDTTSGGPFSFLKEPVKKFTDLFKNGTVPGKFRTYHISSSFIVNFWQSILMLFLIVFFILLACLLIKCLSKTSKVYSIIKLVISTLKWNFFMIMYCGTVGDIVLYSALEFQTAHLDDIFSNISLLVCAGFNGLTAIVVYTMIYVNINIRKSKDKGDETTKEIEEKWEHLKAFFGTYKDNFFGQQIFLLVFILRVACFNAIVGYAYEYPLTQAITIAVINLIMALYLIIMRPLKARINLIQQITFELLLLIFNVSVCILAVADRTKSDAFELRKALGDIIISLNIIVPFLSTAFIGVKIILLAIEASRNYRKSKAGKTPPKISINRLNRMISEKDESMNDISKSPMVPMNISSNLDLNSNNNSGIFDISNYEPEHSSYFAGSHSHSHNLSMQSERFISPSIRPLRQSPKTKKRLQPPPHSLSPNPIQLIPNHVVVDSASSNNIFDVRTGSRAFREKPKMSPYSKEAKMLRRPQYRKPS